MGVLGSQTVGPDLSGVGFLQKCEPHRRQGDRVNEDLYSGCGSRISRVAKPGRVTAVCDLKRKPRVFCLLCEFVMLN